METPAISRPLAYGSGFIYNPNRKYLDAVCLGHFRKGELKMKKDGTQTLILNTEKGLMGFYEANMEIPEGYTVNCTKVRVTQEDHQKLAEGLKAYYRRRCDEKQLDVTDQEIAMQVNMDLLRCGPGVDYENLENGRMRLNEGYLSPAEKKAA